MNWVGGSRNRIKMSEEEKKKKEFFERQRQLGKEAMASSSKSGVSQDIVSMKTVDKVNRNPWHLNTKGDRSLKAKFTERNISRSKSRLNHVDMSPTLGKPGQVKHPQEILNRALRGSSTVPAWTNFVKPFSAPKEPSSPKESASRGTSSNIPYSKLSNTPSSARVKRQPSGGDQPSSFFDELPEFKRLKSSQQQDCTSSKFDDFATPGYKTDQLFDSNVVVNSKDKSDASKKDSMFSFLSESVSNSIFLPNQGTVSFNKRKSNLPKPVFAKPKSTSSKNDTDVLNFDITVQDSLTSLLAAPKANMKLASSSRREESAISDISHQSRQKRSECSEKSLDWSIPRQVLDSRKANESLPSFGILDETRNSFPPDFNFSEVLNSDRPELQGSSFLPSQKVSQEMMDRRFRNSWLMMKETPLVSKPRLSHSKEFSKFVQMDESRDLFSDTITGSNLPIPTFSDTEDMISSSIKSHKSNSELLVVNETISQSESFGHEQNISSPYISCGGMTGNSNAPVGDLSDLSGSSMLSTARAEKMSNQCCVVSQTAESSCQTDDGGAFLIGTQLFKSALYSIFDHPYSKSTMHQRTLMNAVRQLKALGIEPEKHEIQTQTTNIFPASSKIREESDSQHSKSPPPRDHQLDEIVHFGESDFSSELEVMDSTPTSNGNSTGACDNLEPENQNKVEECSDEATTLTKNINKSKADMASQSVCNSSDENDDIDSCLTSISLDTVKGGISDISTGTNQERASETHSPEVVKAQNFQSPKTKPRPIIWPDEEMFFVKLPDLPHPSQCKAEINDPFLNSHFISGRDEVTNSFKSVQPENMILKITNSKPVKSESSQQKFVPFFTSQAARKPTEKGTEEDPINLNPDNKPIDPPKPNVPKKSPFMIVGRTVTSSIHKAKPFSSKESDKCVVQLDGNSSIISEESSKFETENENFPESAKSSLVPPEDPDAMPLAAQDIERTISPPPLLSSPIPAVASALEHSGTLSNSLPSRKCASSSEKQSAIAQPTFYSQQLSNQKLLLVSSSQPVGNTNNCFQHTSANQTVPVLLSEE
ncbi:hypothetical protein ACHWQZ_G014160 [Mnemiopsis leidyi]